MSDASQPGTARGTTLTAGVMVVALFALLAFAPLASAAPDPLGTGSTTVTLNNGFTKSLKNKGVTIQKLAPAKLKGKKATFSVTGGELDPLTGLGTVNLSGGLKFKAGKKSVAVKELVLDTTKKALNAKIGGQKTKLASVSGYSYVRNGFGVNVAVKKLKLTGSAASKLNKKLGKTKPKAFTGNKLMGSSSGETQPLKVVLVPGGNVNFAATPATLAKLAAVEVKITPIAPTATPSLGTFDFPITGGTLSPTASAGVVESAGGLVLEQELKFPAEVAPTLKTKITLGGFWVDFDAKTIRIDGVAESNASKDLNLGPLGRTSIGNVTVASVTSDPTARTISVASSATLQEVAAKVLNGFVEVYEGYKQALGAPETKEKINNGDPLGTFSFTAQSQ